VSDIADIVRCLSGGGVGLLPTDTVYGLAASPDHDAAVARIFALKRRPRTVSLPVMVAAREQLASLGAIVTSGAERLLASPHMPGPLTVAFRVDRARAPAWLSGRTEVAVRMPDHPLMLAVLREAGPLLVTSANAHGATTPESLADALAQLDGAPDIAIDGGVLSSTPSTLVNCATSPATVERVGAIPAHVIEALLK
jgi:L-threonylcarbamoyladenylate synthase